MKNDNDHCYNRFTKEMMMMSTTTINYNYTLFKNKNNNNPRDIVLKIGAIIGHLCSVGLYELPKLTNGNDHSTAVIKKKLHC